MGHFWDERTNVGTIALDADSAAPSTDVRKYTKTSWQVNMTPATAAGTLTLQGSLDNVVWVDLAGTSQAYTGATTVLAWDPVFSSMKYQRVSVNTTSGAGGTGVILFGGVWES